MATIAFLYYWLSFVYSFDMVANFLSKIGAIRLSFLIEMAMVFDTNWRERPISSAISRCFNPSSDRLNTHSCSSVSLADRKADLISI